MSDQQGNEAPVPEFVSGTEEVRQVALPGAQLAGQRQAKGWSVEHAASQLKFATRQVIALEADNYAALPGPVIVRGFVRAYAKLLGLDANALVALLPQEGSAHNAAIVPQRTLSTPFSESPLPLGNRSKISPGLIVGGILVVILAGAAVAVHETDVFDGIPQLAWLKSAGNKAATTEEPQAQAQAQAETQDLPPEVQDGSDKSKLEKVESAVASATNSAITNVSERVASVVSAQSPQPEAAPAEKPAASAQPAAAAAVTSAPVNPTSPVTGGLNISNSKDLLRLTFREDSWVEIRRNDKTTMISRLLKAGTSESFDITEPVTLVIGNAAGVDASLRGSRLDLQTSSNSNVARLSLK
ncbi:hypothetical protein PMI16_01138 [Herbaspirillum sp. CF444]|uniref:RodZ domain-containing protein n=1 Tax=Herbaspirillum sp. CF444 TaxID=1144319 RepID=UPI0002727E58|nr:RodZ domain-containing protein [Herbaspirillum sp. CF444]EJL92199.1 hypothetical protein PMI16_01138 [Herbaspirillum sp. CF444]